MLYKYSFDINCMTYDSDIILHPYEEPNIYFENFETSIQTETNFNPPAETAHMGNINLEVKENISNTTFIDGLRDTIV
jgi:hypothetical protein